MACVSLLDGDTDLGCGKQRMVTLCLVPSLLCDEIRPFSVTV